MVSGRLDPGIGMTTGDVASIQARQTRCGLRRAARPPGERAERLPTSPARDAAQRRPRQEGDAQLVRARAPARSCGTRASTGSAPRPGARRGSPVRARICPGLAFEMPAIRIFPSSRRSRERADGLVVRHLGIGPVVLVEADRLDAETRERRLAGGPEMRGRAVERPRAAARSQVPALRGDEYGGGVAAVAGQRRGDQRLVVPASLGSRRYASAVSIRVTPASRAAWMVVRDRLRRPGVPRSTSASRRARSR